jgi:Na+-transporting NADH:ubiquinone oxidoreductase subunit A
MTIIRKGLDLPIAGAPEQAISFAPNPRTVALVAADYVGLKPNMLVREGDSVRLGQPVIEDKSRPGVLLTSPGTGRVIAVHRGQKRRLLSLVVQLGDEDDSPQFEPRDLSRLSSEQIRETLIASGLWGAFRTRPYSRMPAVDAQPHSIFVTAMDTNPLAADPALIIREGSDDFVFGLIALTRLAGVPVYVCHATGAEIPGSEVAGVTLADFSGPHPAGLPGTHIHFLDPVNMQKSVWYLGYQDVIACGTLFQSGRINTDRIVSLAGPAVKKPRLLRTRMGACLDEMLADELTEGDNRIISGSVFTGRTSESPCNYLGRYDTQISVLQEGSEREFLGWQKPGFHRFSVTRAFASSWVPGLLKDMKFTTSTGGSRRAMVPIGVYERVMPLDLLPTQLLRALIVRDTEQASELGCLELDEEDVALCTFVCPSKYNYGPMLRENLTKIELEG